MLQVGGAGDRSPGEPLGADWVVRARHGQAAEVLAEVTEALRGEVSDVVRVEALYAQAVALHRLERPDDALPVARALAVLCRDRGLVVAGIRARSLIGELLDGRGAADQALEELARAVVVEAGLPAPEDPQTLEALAELAGALRVNGVFEEARRVEARLAEVDDVLPVRERVRQAHRAAFERAVRAVVAARPGADRSDAGPGPLSGPLSDPLSGPLPDPQADLLAAPLPDVAELREALAELRGAERLATDGEYPQSAAATDVLAALLAAVAGDPQEALDRLDACQEELWRGPQPIARHLWGCARLRALLRLGRGEQARTQGRRLLREAGSGEDQESRMALALELMRVEETVSGEPATGARACLDLVERQSHAQAVRVAALFRSRVDALRGVDERRALARAARLDTLTGLVNRRGAAAALAVAAGRPEPVPVALLLIDLDGFGRINDDCGHLIGDVVLQRVAATLRAETRPEDVVARWNADEFLVITARDAAGAAELADGIRAVIRDGGDSAAGDAVTASVGIAMRVAPVTDQAWLRQAEVARHTASRAGGDATVLQEALPEASRQS